MWLLADGPVSLSDGVCVFLGNGPILFWLGKNKPFMLWSGKNQTRVCSTRRYLLVGRGKKKKPTVVVPVGICRLVVIKKEKPTTS